MMKSSRHCDLPVLKFISEKQAIDRICCEPLKSEFHLATRAFVYFGKSMERQVNSIVLVCLRLFGWVADPTTALASTANSMNFLQHLCFSLSRLTGNIEKYVEVVIELEGQTHFIGENNFLSIRAAQSRNFQKLFDSLNAQPRKTIGNLILKIPDHMADSGIRQQDKLINTREVIDAVQKGIKRKPRLKCRSPTPDATGVSDSTPQKILHLVELCYDINKNPVDCPTEG